MSTSFYRGELHTNKEIKGPFTEAHDDFSIGFKHLVDAIAPGEKVEVYCRPSFPAEVEEVMFKVGETWIIINKAGLIEIGESGA